MAKKAKKSVRKKAVKRKIPTAQGKISAAEVAYKKPPKKCSNQEERFCQEYLIDLNAERAAIRAGYSRSTARKKAASWVAKSRHTSTKPHVWDRVHELMAEREKRTGIAQDKVLQELAVIGFSDITRFLEVTKNHIKLKDLSELPLGETSCVAELSEFESDCGKRRLKFKLHDKIKSLELIGRHLGMFTENVHQTGEVKHSGVLLTSEPMNKDQWFAFCKKLEKRPKQQR